MAEIITSAGKKKNLSVKKGKRLSTRVDLTPMVDLGFLLITFFIFTTTMAQGTAMPLFLPDDSAPIENQNQVIESNALTILIGQDDNIFYYEGILEADGSNIQTTDGKGIRAVIISKKRRTDSSELVVIIKPGEKCTYKGVVNILNEMSINVIRRYALVSSLFPAEIAAMQVSGKPTQPFDQTVDSNN